MSVEVKEFDPATESPHDERVRRVEILISNLLRIGVLVSLLVIVIGTVMSFVHHPTYLHSHQDYVNLTKIGTEFPHTLRQVAQGVRHGHGEAIVTAGLLLLITTPVVRVAVSIFAFVYQHDRTFVVITTIVLLLLLLSFVLGKVEG
jgi:uncharacterized membrane protein